VDFLGFTSEADKHALLDGSTGLLVDDFEGMVAATERLLRDAGLRNRMEEIARAHASRFTWAAATKSFRRVLARCAQGLPPVSEQAAGAALDVLLGAVVEDLAGRSLSDSAGGHLGALRGHRTDQGGRGRDGCAPATQRS